MNDKRIASYFLDAYQNGRFIIGRQGDRALLSDGFIIVAVPLGRQFFKKYFKKYQGVVPEDGESCVYKEKQPDAATPNLIQRWEAWGCPDTPRSSLLITRWIYDEQMPRRVFLLLDRQYVFVQERFLRLLWEDEIAEGGESYKVTSGYEELWSSFEFFGTSPEEAVRVRQGKQLVAVFMPMQPPRNLERLPAKKRAETVNA